MKRILAIFLVLTLTGLMIPANALMAAPIIYSSTNDAVPSETISTRTITTDLPEINPTPVDPLLAETETYQNLLAAVTGETNAYTSYYAFAEKAREDGNLTIARLFTATGDAEAKHADDEWAILESMGATVRPTVDPPAVGPTKENLQTAFDGETYEYTTMYPEFIATAEAEGNTAAARIFRLAMRAEQVHAINYSDVYDNFENMSYIDQKYAVVFRCPVCGEVVTSRPDRCPICGANGDSFVMYNQTYFNLLAAVTGETNAYTSYYAFAEKAREDGNLTIARLFTATGDAEAKHADDEWAILESMGATVRPTVDPPAVGTTKENLQTAFDGETYEYTTMYPEFIATAEAEGNTAAARIFRLAMRAEQVHAINYSDVYDNFENMSYIDQKYAVVFRCPVCGEVVTSRPDRCPICGANGDSFIMYNQTYFNLLAAVTGETNAYTSYYAFAEKAREDGNLTIARLFTATGDAEAKHADDEWAILESMGATVRPTVDPPAVGTTKENLQTAFDGETYEYTTMYPEFIATAEAEGNAAAARIFRLAMRAEQVHAINYSDVYDNFENMSYIDQKYAVVFRCPVCGEVVTSRPDRCPICGANGDSFVMYSFASVSFSVDEQQIASLSEAAGKTLAITVQLDGATPADFNGLLISALYNNDGSLASVRELTIPDGESDPLNLYQPLPEDTTGMKLSVFIWAADTYEPLIPSVMID